jgi:hypothetical protein
MRTATDLATCNEAADSMVKIALMVSGAGFLAAHAPAKARLTPPEAS